MAERVGTRQRGPERKPYHGTSEIKKGNDFTSMVSPVDKILNLQRTIGNRAVTRLIEAGTLQANLTVDKTSEIHVKEAEPAKVTPSLESTIDSLKAGGQSLPVSSRDFFEPRFGADFSKVRLHTGNRAAEAAQAINARAFTAGRHVVFGEGQYAPETAAGKQLLAHELTHTIQQGVTPFWGKTGKTAGSPVSGRNPIYWGSRQRRADRQMIFRDINDPVPKSLLHIQIYVPNALGSTLLPENYKAPNFKFNSFKTTKGWFAKPNLTQTAYEGDSVSWYTYSSNKHLVTMSIPIAPGVERIVPVHMKVSNAISKLAKEAELEHCNDMRHAYKISLKEANGVLTQFIMGQTFGPAPTQNAVENLVLNRFQAKLAHPQLGRDKTKWAAKYEQLFQMTTIRDDPNKWHDFIPKFSRAIAKGGSIVGFEAEIIKTKYTNIGNVPSSAIIKY